MKLDIQVDFSSIRGQEHIKRAIEVAIAGSHSLAIYGQPGVGKTLLMKAAADLTFQKFMFTDNLTDDLMNYRVKGYLEQHTGPVFVETWPCSCGYFGDTFRGCSCSPEQLTNYWNQSARALLAACDMHVEAPNVGIDDLLSTRPGKTSAQIFERVEGAWQVQAARFKGYRDGDNLNLSDEDEERPYKYIPARFNSDLSDQELQEYCPIDSAGKTLLKSAYAQLGLSARSYFQIIKLARTIADLSSYSSPEKPVKSSSAYIAEAIQYRRKAQ